MISNNLSKTDLAIKGLSNTSKELLTAGPVDQAIDALSLLNTLPTYCNLERVLPTTPILVSERITSLTESQPEDAFALLKSAENTLAGQIDLSKQKALLFKALAATLLNLETKDDLLKRFLENEIQSTFSKALAKNTPWQSSVVLPKVFLAANKGDHAGAKQAYQTFATHKIPVPTW